MRIYTDTSVFGGVFEIEFEKYSKAYFERVRAGHFEVIVSALVEDELQAAPNHVRGFFAETSPYVTKAEVVPDAFALRRAYLEAQVLSPRWAADALHVAMATSTGCHVIVSWNFKHIVNFQRIPLYNGVNQVMGYSAIAIHTPAELMFYGER